MGMETSIIRNSHAQGMQPSKLRLSSRPQQEGIIVRDDADAQQPVVDTASTSQDSHLADLRTLNLAAIAEKSLRLADMTAAYRAEKPHAPTNRTLAPESKSGSATAAAAAGAGAVTKRRTERRFRCVPRPTRSRLQAMHKQRLGPGSEETLRRDEAEGERDYFSRHVGVRFHGDPCETGAASRQGSVLTADREKDRGRVEGPVNRPACYHRDWVSKRDLCDRGQMGVGMYSLCYVHVHDQLYFQNEAGNRMWLVDDEGQAIFIQSQTL